MLTVKQLKEQLEGIPDDTPVFVYDIAYADLYRVEGVDTTISDRVDINIDINQDEGLTDED
jgi:hypothetical protein